MKIEDFKLLIDKLAEMHPNSEVDFMFPAPRANNADREKLATYKGYTVLAHSNIVRIRVW